MNASTLGISGLTVSSFSAAGASMSKIQAAIDKVSKQRSALGAIQNRLEHTINNLDTTSENTQSAESRIRDTDMATEMVQYSATSIIQQAGQSMLAQANSQTQGVLSLIQ
jgi:flagellin